MEKLVVLMLHIGRFYKLCCCASTVVSSLFRTNAANDQDQ